MRARTPPSEATAATVAKKSTRTPRTGRPRKPKTVVPAKAVRGGPKPVGYAYGRPTTYLPDYCSKVVELGLGGLSPVQIASQLGTTRQTMNGWKQAHPEFAAAMVQSAEHAQAFWEEVGATGARTKTVDGAIWTKIMTQRFKEDWKEVKAVEHSGQIDTGRQSIVDDILGLVAKSRVKDLV